MELRLIELYVWVCLVYDKHPSLKYQRLSNNWKPEFTDQELVTIYLFGHLQGHYEQKRIYQYTQEHFADWFPRLPSYQAFNGRLNQVSEVLKVMVFELLAISFGKDYYFDDFVLEEDSLMDALPIMLAVRSRAWRAKVALSEADVGYCASKEIYYHGVKLHLLGRKRVGQLPTPEGIKLTPASTHDLQVLQEFEGKIWGNLFADKAYTDA